MSEVFEFSSGFSTQDLHLCETLEAEPHDAEWGEGAELKRDEEGKTTLRRILQVMNYCIQISAYTDCTYYILIAVRPTPAHVPPNQVYKTHGNEADSWLVLSNGNSQRWGPDGRILGEKIGPHYSRLKKTLGPHWVLTPEVCMDQNGATPMSWCPAGPVDGPDGTKECHPGQSPSLGSDGY